MGRKPLFSSCRLSPDSHAQIRSVNEIVVPRRHLGSTPLPTRISLTHLQLSPSYPKGSEVTNVGGLVSGFMFSHYWVEKKKPFQTKKKTASTAERACPESTENFPILPPQLLCHRPDRPVLEGFSEGVGARLSRVSGTAPLEVAALAFLLKGRGGPLQGPLALESVALSGWPRTASGLGQPAQDRQGPGKKPT